ncbi:fimbria/pilus outer membrane usher protein [Serratia marcescens]|uniref:fimbria/pilus outer membrane usher protein n=1 Tax=Serratia marcescens TaxID=615 RepID=UPI0024C4C1F0|nr:fimbria/pilus outer membrane usher protein [Serratia marcescens]MDK1711726.1 fimbria/pilus outer membrane usher protein [Serratia marcescens]
MNHPSESSDSLLPSRLALVLGLLCSPGAQARAYTFDPTMLGDQGKNVDMAQFNQGGQLPGTYTVDVLLNGNLVDSRNVDFFLDKSGGTTLQPCLDVKDLARYGVKVDEYPGLAGQGKCALLSAIPQATSDFQFYAQQLLLNVPQASLQPVVTGIAPQQLWDDGVPSLLLNYLANTNRTEYRQGTSLNQTANYIQLNPGANWGPWRLRNQTSWQKQGDREGQWQTTYTYAERGINPIKSRLTLGERSSPGDVFEGVPFRGVMLGTDDGMSPYNQRSFAPVVRGIARTQARVEVKQNGFTIYNATVAPGPFALADLSTSGSSGGDLQVTVWEADGNNQVFMVSYQTPAISLREGYLDYNVMVGQYRPADAGIDKKPVSQATVMYGMPWSLTAYTGFQAASHFQSGALGLGKSLGDWGAVSVDAILAHGQRRDQRSETGVAWRLRYSKQVIATNTTLSLTTSQYASAAYNTLSDVLDTWRGEAASGSGEAWFNGSYDRRRSTLSVQLSQSLGGMGAMNLNGQRSDYYTRPGYDDSVGVSYSFTLHNVLVSLDWTKTKQVSRSGGQRDDRQTSLWVSVPLGQGGNTRATYQLSSPSTGGDTSEVGLNGRAVDQQLNWDIRQRHHAGEGSNGNSSALRMDWSGTYGQVGGNYTYSPNQRQMGADLSGGVLVHPHGVTLSQTLGDTIALVEAPGAAGVTVSSGTGVKTDFRGYTAQAFLTPYQENTVSLDPANLPQDAEISQTDKKVVPTRGAVVAAKFSTRLGGRALMTLTTPGGGVVPFGALVTVKGEEVGAGVVGDKGQVYLTGLPVKGELLVSWSAAQCSVTYQLPGESGPAGVFLMDGECRQTRAGAQAE